LTVDDLQKSPTFYEALAFAVGERWEDRGTLLGVMRAPRQALRIRIVGALVLQKG
jgi:predicted lactoylglutathione lyase